MVILLQAVTMWLVVGASPLSQSDPCSGAKDRPRDYLHAEWSALHYNATIHESFYMTPVYRSAIKDMLKYTGETFYYSGKQFLDCSADASSDAALEHRSLCPWFWNLNYDGDRYPDKLAEARCSCEDCDAGRKQCERINYNIIVLRKNEEKCTDDYYEYEMGYQPVSVGCTCALSTHLRV